MKTKQQDATRNTNLNRRVQHACSGPLWGIGTALLLLGLMGGLVQSQAATYVGGSIVGQHWRKANSPYYVTNNILVLGTGLTIDAGVWVLALDNWVFEVAGTCTASGTKAEPIVFTRTNDVGGWQGIFFNESNPSELVYCVVSNSINSGIRIRFTSPIIRDCTIAFNQGYQGGGINANLASSDLVITRTTIVNNRAKHFGGGICFTNFGTLVLADCDVLSNEVRDTGAYHWSYGGGVFVAHGNAILSNRCVIASNHVESISRNSQATGGAFGGGVCVWPGSLLVKNSEIVANIANAPNASDEKEFSRGGGIYVATGSLAMTNAIVAHNTSTATDGADGAGVCLGLTLPWQSNPSAVATIVNCTIAYNNTHGVAASPFSVVGVHNSIVYFNNGGGTQFNHVMGESTAEYSDVQNGYPGNGNISCHPSFWPDNLMIVDGSCCMDAGDPDHVYDDVCFYGLFSLGTVRNDMGAHGGPGACGWCVPPAIVSQPQRQSSCLGQSTTFCVAASGTPPLAYQWWFNGSPVVGQTSNCLVLENLQSSEAGAYWVVVSNVCDSVTSSVAQLVVNDACVDIHMYAGLTIAGQSGQTYVLKYTTDLSNTNFDTWTPLATNTMGDLPWFYLDMESPFSPRRSYGVKKQ